MGWCVVGGGGGLVGVGFLGLFIQVLLLVGLGGGVGCLLGGGRGGGGWAFWGLNFDMSFIIGLAFGVRVAGSGLVLSGGFVLGLGLLCPGLGSS